MRQTQNRGYKIREVHRGLNIYSACENKKRQTAGVQFTNLNHMNSIGTPQATGGMHSISVNDADEEETLEILARKVQNFEEVRG